MCFIDYQKAFYTVNHKDLSAIFIRLDIERKDMKIIE